MAIKLALAGNPNSGKTTLFNALTGSNQSVGNWPGVTVEKKEGTLRGARDVVIQDLPGIYSLSPYTLEEVVARAYLVSERPDAILNVVDATNIERNLFLTMQLLELGIPMVVALNMIDVARKSGDRIDCAALSKALGCAVVETSALKGEGLTDAAQGAVNLAARGAAGTPAHRFAPDVEDALAIIQRQLDRAADARLSRWYAVKLFERDERVRAALNLPHDAMAAIEDAIAACERALDDDAESIITSQRYAHIAQLSSACVKKGRPRGTLTPSDRIDRVLTNRFLALPIFALVMFFVYYISVTTVGALLTDFTNDTFVADWIQSPVTGWLTGIGTASWLVGLIGDGIIGGVGAVIGFVPQMLVLFFLLALLEDVGYMSRVAFIMDRIFRRFGLSGKSFIPMLISSGCGVPGIMASRTIENDRDRKMTIITTTFIPCSAKMPIVALVAGALFHNAGWVAATAYFIGVAAVIISGILLKKTRAFSGDPAPFVMELPAYHVPSMKNVLGSMGERGWSFIRRAGTVVLAASILIWFTSGYGWPAEQTADAPSSFGAVEDMDHSILGRTGSRIAPAFEPLGFGAWQPTVATIMGLVAKEEVVSVFGVLYGITDEEGEDAAMGFVEEGDAEAMAQGLSPIALAFDESSGGHGALAAFAFLLFNLLCAPCFAAMGAIKREMNNWKWTAGAILYQCAFAYAAALIVYQLGLMCASAGFTAGSAAALALIGLLLLMLFRKGGRPNGRRNEVAA